MTLGIVYVGGKSGLEFELDHLYGPCRVVDLNALTCSCGKWKLTRIPCIHACSAIYHSRHHPKAYVDECYHLTTYLKAYEQGIQAMSGPEEWLEDSNYAILPPFVRVQPRRTRKARRREPNEPAVSYKISHSGYVV